MIPPSWSLHSSSVAMSNSLPNAKSEMESTSKSLSDSYSKLMEGSWMSQFRGSNPWMARYVYGLMFLVTNLLAWAVRDYGHGLLSEMRRLKECKGGIDCLGAEGVLRVSMGCSIFYLFMFLSTAGTSKLHEHRELWHSGWWSAKITMLMLLLVLSFLVPPAVVSLYGDIAHFGAGVFLLIQLISIISFITWLNEYSRSERYAERCNIQVMLLAMGAHVMSIVGVIMMYIWYTPEPSCMLNIFFITWTIVLLQLMTSVSLHPKINAGILTPGFMGLYVVFLCWSAIRSEPPDEKCIRKAETTAKRDWLTVISFVVAVLAIVIATFSTGIDSQCFQFRKDEAAEKEDDVPYGYAFFHFVFATGAMYFAMLLIGWNSHHPMEKWTIDVGWTSTWVRIVNEWLAAVVYIWMLVAPIIWKSRQAAESPLCDGMTNFQASL